MKTFILILTALAISHAPLRAGPMFQSVSQSGDTIPFTWSAVSGMMYEVQYTTDLNSGDWIDLGCPILATGTTASASDIIGPDPARFYRVDELVNPIIASATGGDYTFTNGNFISVVFINSGTFTVVCGSAPIESLVVAGGGGSGEFNGGGAGGGAGGLIYTTMAASPVYGPGNYSVVVGAGGFEDIDPPYGNEGSGGNSSFNSPDVQTIGGGSGASQSIIIYAGGGSESPPGGFSGPPGASVLGIQYGNAVCEGYSGGAGYYFDSYPNQGFSYGGGGGAGESGNDANQGQGGMVEMGFFLR
jgi:hypothetical protein